MGHEGQFEDVMKQLRVNNRVFLNVSSSFEPCFSSSICFSKYITFYIQVFQFYLFPSRISCGSQIATVLQKKTGYLIVERKRYHIIL